MVDPYLKLVIPGNDYTLEISEKSPGVLLLEMVPMKMPSMTGIRGSPELGSAGYAEQDSREKKHTLEVPERNCSPVSGFLPAARSLRSGADGRIRTGDLGLRSIGNGCLNLPPVSQR